MGGASALLSRLVGPMSSLMSELFPAPTAPRQPEAQPVCNVRLKDLFLR
jgi:hypothetical protein